MNGSDSPIPAHTTDTEALQARRAALLERLAAIRADIGRGLDRNAEDGAADLENADVLEEIARVAQVELQEIDDRLRELREGGNG